MPSKTAAVIGTREPDAWQKQAATQLTLWLCKNGYQVYTGAAKGVDQICMENATPGQLWVVLPWFSYNSGIVPSHAQRIVYDPWTHRDWTQSIGQFHPAPQRLSSGARSLMARNFGIVFTRDLVCALPDEYGGGGTGQGIRIARFHNVPLLELRRGSNQPLNLVLEQAQQLAGIVPETH